jgi:DDE superfamily endonuclease
MHTPPPQLTSIILAFAPLFWKRTWEHAQVLLWGAILAPGKRTVTSALRIMGLSEDRHFENYHRVLNRARWSCLKASRVLLNVLLSTFAPSGPLVFGLDDTIERRRGEKIRARGIYRDPVRSSQTHFVKTGGLRWLSLMLLTPIPWAQRVWALPFLTALTPSERFSQEHRQRHKPLTSWARQLLLQLRRWLPDRDIVLLTDQAFSALEFLTRLQSLRRPITCITRLRTDARLFNPPPARRPKRAGRPRLVGKRLPKLQQRLQSKRTSWTKLTVNHWYGAVARQVEYVSGTAIWYHGGFKPLPIRWVLIRDPLSRFDPLALLCTDPRQAPDKILAWFVQRWQVEVTFQQVRAHVGFETQRQWSDLAIARTSPILLGLFSLITVLANSLASGGQLPISSSSWYRKSLPTFADAISLVRQRYWHLPNLLISSPDTKVVKIPVPIFNQLSIALCWAA